VALSPPPGRRRWKVRQHDRAAGAQWLTDPQLGQALAVTQQPFQHHLDAAAAVLAAEQPRRYDAGVVEHEQVAGAQQARQVTEAAVAQLAAREGHVQQAAVRAAR
jgi:hypothetical protein